MSQWEEETIAAAEAARSVGPAAPAYGGPSTRPEGPAAAAYGGPSARPSGAATFGSLANSSRPGRAPAVSQSSAAVTRTGAANSSLRQDDAVVRPLSLAERIKNIQARLDRNAPR
jgi:hypothetical protein